LGLLDRFFRHLFGDGDCFLGLLFGFTHGLVVVDDEVVLAASVNVLRGKGRTATTTMCLMRRGSIVALAFMCVACVALGEVGGEFQRFQPQPWHRDGTK
jgi:hypothetical protein